MGDSMGPDSIISMTPSDAESFVIAILRSRGSLTTMEIELLAAAQEKKCPDQTVIFLTKMRRKGLIRGEVSQEKRGWLWSLPE